MGKVWDHGAKEVFGDVLGEWTTLSPEVPYSPNNSVVICKHQNPLFVRIAVSAFVSGCFCSYLFSLMIMFFCSFLWGTS